MAIAFGCSASIDANIRLRFKLGGSDPHELASCAKIGEDFGYDEIKPSMSAAHQTG